MDFVTARQRMCWIAALSFGWFFPLQSACAAVAMRITNISDFNLGTWSLGLPAPSAHIDICIYSLDVIPPGGYAITATGAGGFTLTSGANTLAYMLHWDDAGIGNLGGALGSELSSGVKLTGQLHGNVLSSTCALTGPNARLTLKITQAAMTAALAGTYTGTVTLLLTPN